MPEKNRDTETLYPAGTLSLWFLATSGLLFASLVWMLLADHYDHPWRTYQADYFKKQAEIFKGQREYAEGRLGQGEHRKAVEDLGRHLRDAHDAVEGNPEVKRLRERKDELQKQIGEFDRDIKAVKGDYSAARFQVEDARVGQRLGHTGEESVKAAADEEKRLFDLLGKLEQQKSQPAADLIDVDNRLTALTKDEKDLKKKFDDLIAGVTSAEMQYADASQKTEKNVWRNLPGMDFLAPTIRIEKVVCKNIHNDFNFDTSPKVDMCMTCHMGIAKDPLSKTPYFDSREHPAKTSLFDPEDPSKGTLVSRFDVALVHQAHPALDVMVGSSSPHKMESFGCTVCHGGQGWSTDFTRAAHTPDETDEARWKRELKWHEAEFIDFPMLPMKYVEGQCLKCHMQGLYYEPGFVVDEYMPDLDDPCLLGTPDLKKMDIAKAKAVSLWRPGFEKLGRMGLKDPKDGWYVPPAPAPKPLADPLAAERAPWHPRRLERAMKLVREWGCQGCHLMKSGLPDAGDVVYGTTPGYPRAPADAEAADFSAPQVGTLTASGIPKVGWDLSRVADKLKKEFVAHWIEEPTAFRIDTRMPSFYKYRLHDDDYQPVDESGHVLPAGAPGVDKTIIVYMDDAEAARLEPPDHGRRDAEIDAITSYLMWMSNPDRKGQYPEPPVGDEKKGSQIFYSVGCYGCHISKGKWDDTKQAWEPDDGSRFRVPDLDHPGQTRMDVPPGPRLTAMGSKTSAAWLYSWLKEPRHYWSTTRMPNMRWRDRLGADNKTVERSADQIRADVVAYLMAQTDPAFAAPNPHTSEVAWQKKALEEMWLEYYGKGQVYALATARYAGMKEHGDEADRGAWEPDPADPDHVRLRPAVSKMGQYEAVGYKLVLQRGCFGCHNIPGYEYAQPIGKDLSKEGSQDVHKFDFGVLGKPVSTEVPDTRWGWIHQKLVMPRIFDKGRVKQWTERLRMPKFNFVEEDREAVTAFVLGLVSEPIKDPAIFHPNASQRAILDGRAVVLRYNCNQCHTIEGRQGVLWAEQMFKQQMEGWMLPPNLFGEGNRVRADWLFRFLKDPDSVGRSVGLNYLRPGVIQRMPKFRLSDDEAHALVSMFLALAGRDPFSYDALDAPLDQTYDAPVEITLKVVLPDGTKEDRKVTASSSEQEAHMLFDAFECAKCHLPRGTPGADPNDGGSAPPFTLAGPRLRREWMVELLKDPQTQIQGTKMVSFWPIKTVRQGKTRVHVPGETRTLDHPEFSFGCRGSKCSSDVLADAQIENLARWVLYHYKPAPPPTQPPTPDAAK